MAMIIFIFFFFLGIQQNLHIVLIMDSANLNFIINCESNPALHKKCQVLWMEGWSDSSMRKVSSTLKYGNEKQHIFFLKLQIFLTLLWCLLYYLDCDAEHTCLQTSLFSLCFCMTLQSSVELHVEDYVPEDYRGTYRTLKIVFISLASL